MDVCLIGGSGYYHGLVLLVVIEFLRIAQITFGDERVF